LFVKYNAFDKLIEIYSLNMFQLLLRSCILKTKQFMNVPKTLNIVNVFIFQANAFSISYLSVLYCFGGFFYKCLPKTVESFYLLSMRLSFSALNNAPKSDWFRVQSYEGHFQMELPISWAVYYLDTIDLTVIYLDESKLCCFILTSLAELFTNKTNIYIHFRDLSGQKSIFQSHWDIQPVDAYQCKI
jgi:hypothetical protein